MPAIFTRRTIAATCIVGALVFMALVAGILMSSDSRSLARVAACAKQTTDFVRCVRPEIVRLMKTNTPGETMAALSTTLSPVTCHIAGHVVGQELYGNYKSVESAMAACGPACGLSCPHGVISEALSEQLGMADVGFDTLHMSGEEIRKFGKRICTNTDTCHGVGHALFQAYREYGPSVAACADIAEGFNETYCLRGVFMEYADTVSYGPLREVGAEIPIDTARPESLCDQPAQDVRRECLRYFARVSVPLLTKQELTSPEIRTQLKRSCMTLTGVLDRRACMAGIGVAYSNIVFSDPALGRSICEDFPTAPDKSACVLGMISSAIELAEFRKGLAFCKGFSDPIRHECYQDAFFTIDMRGSDVATVKALCEGDTACLNGAAAYKKNPWK